MTNVTVTYDWQEKTFATDVKITDVLGKLYIAPSGTTNMSAGVPFRGAGFFPAGTYAMRGPATFERVPYTELNAPAPFAVGDWTVADHATASSGVIDIDALPELNGFDIVSIDWTDDAGATWTSLTRTTLGTEVELMSSGDIQLRVVTEQGASAPSDVKAVVIS